MAMSHVIKKMQEIKQTSTITTSEFSAKFRSKYEVYQFLTIDALAFLPAPECCTIYFLKDLVAGKKKCESKNVRFILTCRVTVLKSDKALNLHVPCYEGLTVKEIMSKGLEHDDVRNYLPDDRDIRRLPRQWIVNVIYSL